MMEIYTRYSLPHADGMVFDEPSLTDQSFAHDADIHTILAHFAETGNLIDPTVARSAGMPVFGDFVS